MPPKPLFFLLYLTAFHTVLTPPLEVLQVPPCHFIKSQNYSLPEIVGTYGLPLTDLNGEEVMVWIHDTKLPPRLLFSINHVHAFNGIS